MALRMFVIFREFIERFKRNNLKLRDFTGKFSESKKEIIFFILPEVQY